jgi:outer membrane protein W
VRAVLHGTKPGLQRRAMKYAIGALAAVLVLAAAPAAARAEAPWWKRRLYVRGIGLAYLSPLEQSREMELADVDGAASLAVQNGPIAGSGATISSAFIPAASIGFRLPVLNDRLSLEVLAGAPPTVKFRATGTLANESLAPTALGIPTGLPPLGTELGEAKAVPPLVTAVYQLRPEGALRPYAGVGIAVLFAMNAKITNPILSEVSQPDFDIAPAPGFVMQAGLDARLWKQIYARVDVKFIAGMLATAEVRHAEVRTPLLPLFDTVEVGTAKMSMWVNPLIVQAGVGFDFTMF